MMCVALLRGINVGGKRKVEMKQLKATVESAGMDDVRTYINSGNVIFRSDATVTQVVHTLESAIQVEFGFPVEVFLRDADNIRTIVQAMPGCWVDGKDAKCNVIFLSRQLDSKDILDQLTIKPGIDDVRYVPGAILWRVERPNITRSGMLRLIGTAFYASITVRNCNTVRKLHALMGWK
jgi:uncharacterized protein (DUF1697 family)